MRHDLQSTRHPADISYEILKLTSHDWVPNNRRLPVLIYRRALAPSTNDLGQAFEALFARNAWPPQWRDSIFVYHHFHSSAHEMLGVISGKGT